MIKKTYTFTDFNGVERTEDYRFNLRETELAEFMAKYGIDFQTYLEGVLKTQDTAKMMSFFKDFILSAYGEIKNNGAAFIHSAEISENFYYSEAYELLLNELLDKPENVTEFFRGCLDNKLGAKFDEAKHNPDVQKKLKEYNVEI